MKGNYINYLGSILVVLGLAFASCEGPEGPAGDPGADGVNGSTECMACHNENTDLKLKMVQFAESAHSLGTYYTRGGQCAACHSTEGFLDLQNHTAVSDIDNMELEMQSPISCYTCHKIHQAYDSTDWDLTFVEPVAQTILGYTSPDVDQIAFNDMGDANMCLQCHQARDRGNVPSLTSTADVGTSGHWGPHYGVQGNVLHSAAGVHIAGSASYPTGAVKHDCIRCHMSNGDHTLAVNYDNCTECHSDIEDEMEALHDEVDGLKFTLGAKLAELGYMNVETESEWVWDDANQTHVEMIDTVGFAPISGDVPADMARAMWNYMVVYQDHSYGAHNPDYIKALLTNTLESLE